MSIGQVSDQVVSLLQYRERKEKEKLSERGRNKPTLSLNLDEPTQVLSPGELPAEVLETPEQVNSYFMLSLGKLATTPEEILQQAYEKVIRAQISYQCSLQTYYKFMLPQNNSGASFEEHHGNSKSLSQFLEERCHEVLHKYQTVYNEYLHLAQKVKKLQLPQNKLMLLPGASL